MRRLHFVVAPLCLFISAMALAAEEGKKSDEIRLPLKEFKFKVSQDKADLFVFDEDAQRLCFYTNGAAEAKFSVENAGDYDLVLSLSGDTAMNVHPKFKLAIDDKEPSKETSLKSDDIKDYKFTIQLKHGTHVLSVAFTNDMYKDGEYDSNLYLHGAKLIPHRAGSSVKEP
jgi:hypothetical protein